MDLGLVSVEEITGIPQELIAEIRATTFGDCQSCQKPIPVEAEKCGWCDAPQIKADEKSAEPA